MTTAEQAAKPLLRTCPRVIRTRPGSSRSRTPTRCAGILNDAGWSDVELAPVDLECTLPEPQLEGYFTRLGPVGLACRTRTRRPAPR